MVKKRQAALNMDYALRVADVGAPTTGIYFANLAIQLDPEEHWYYKDRAIIKEQNADYIAAIEDYTRSIEIDSIDGAKYYNRGFVKQKIKDLDGACADWMLGIEKGYNEANADLQKYCKNKTLINNEMNEYFDHRKK